MDIDKIEPEPAAIALFIIAACLAGYYRVYKIEPDKFEVYPFIKVSAIALAHPAFIMVAYIPAVYLCFLSKTGPTKLLTSISIAFGALAAVGLIGMQIYSIRIMKKPISMLLLLSSGLGSIILWVIGNKLF